MLSLLRHSPIPFLKESLSSDILPGTPAHMAVSANPIAEQWEVQPGHLKSAVLILLYPKRTGWYTVMMLRTTGNKTHSGEVSFPGGRMEEKDPDPTFTALRETEEELGVKSSSVEILGSLTPLYIPVSNFLVYPILGYSRLRPRFKGAASEVAEIIEIRLRDLLHSESMREIPMRLGSGLKVQVPSFTVAKYPIWGASAMLLNELLEILRRRY